MEDKLTSALPGALDLQEAHGVVRETVAATEAARQFTVSNYTEFKQLLECLPQAIALLDAEDNLVLWNKNYQKMFPDIAPNNKPGIESIFRMAIEKERPFATMDAAAKEAWLKQRLELLSRGESIVEQNYGDHQWVRYDQHIAPDGKKVFVITDVTDDRNSVDSFRLLFENNPVPMWVVEKSSQRYIDVNGAALEHYGYGREQFLEMTLLDIRPARERGRILEDARTRFGVDDGSEDWIHLKADGSEIIVTTYSKPIKFNSRDAAIVAIIDVTERRKQEARVQYLLAHDEMTGLPNRRFFLELLEGSLSKRKENHHHTSIVLIDIDDFKGVNDTLGHQVGNNLIVAVANRLEECIGDRGVVARLGGDEFVVLLPLLPDPEEAHIAAIELIAAFKKPFAIMEHDLLVRLSAGVSTGLDDSIDASTLLRNADLALHKAKSDGGGACRVYEPQLSVQMIARRKMEHDLRQALSEHQLVIYYQPMLELAGSKEVGFEALLRWNHPEKGMIPPSAFIAVAELSGMIVPIGTWVLEQACQMATTLDENLTIAVNISGAQFKSGKLVEVVSTALRKSGLAARRLELEITESSLLEKSSETLQTLRDLKDLGVFIALDDFGTGYSGLGYLNCFSFDKIKIDRSFIKGVGTIHKSRELVRAAVNIGNSLGLVTLAEGIETAEHLEFLRAMGCKQGQGYLFSPAIPAGGIADWLKLKQSFSSNKLADLLPEMTSI